MSLWQLAACVAGYQRAHNPEPLPPPPTDDEFDKMLEYHMSVTRH